MLYIGFGTVLVSGALLPWQRKSGLIVFALGLALAFSGIVSLGRAERKRADNHARRLARMPARAPAPIQLEAKRSDRPDGLPSRATAAKSRPSAKSRRGPDRIVETNFY